jgi:uncharacterized membrane protein
MAILILGLILFLGIHLVPAIPSLKNSLYDKLGEKTYKGVFSLISIIGLIPLFRTVGRELFLPADHSFESSGT